jgi:hypothetical protein
LEIAMTALIERRLDSALTVAHLIAELESLPPDAPVVFVCDYGDHCHTQQVLPVTVVESMPPAGVGESGYSHSGIALRKIDENEEFEDESRQIVILQYLL